MTYRGKEYLSEVKRYSAGDVGITKRKAEGKVYNLKKLSDFSGKYVVAGGRGDLVGSFPDTGMFFMAFNFSWVF